MLPHKRMFKHKLLVKTLRIQRRIKTFKFQSKIQTQTYVCHLMVLLIDLSNPRVTEDLIYSLIIIPPLSYL